MGISGYGSVCAPYSEGLIVLVGSSSGFSGYGCVCAPYSEGPIVLTGSSSGLVAMAVCVPLILRARLF